MAERPESQRSRRITAPALLALAAGFSLGLIARYTDAAWLLSLARVADPVGTLWTSALRMVVLPLMVSYIVLAINSASTARSAGKLGVTAVIVYLSMLTAAAAFAFFVGARIVAIMPIDDAARIAFRSIPGAGATMPAANANGTVGQWIATLVPTNILLAAADDNYLAVVISTVLFAVGMLRISSGLRENLVRIFQAVADTTDILIGWIIMLLPFAAFALAFSIGAESGTSVAGSVVWFVVGLSALVTLCILLLYPLTAVLAKVTLRKFALAVLPSQTVAAGTRSSLACLPALIDGADNRLGVPTEVSGFVLPLSVSTFKLNPGVSQPFKLLFLASIFGLPLTPGYLIGFTATTILLSFTTAGIPSGGQLLTWPLFLAAGVPIQALVVLKVADAIPDIFNTVLNVTADLSVVAIVTRFVRKDTELSADLSSPHMEPS